MPAHPFHFGWIMVLNSKPAFTLIRNSFVYDGSGKAPVLKKK
jgi:hypothetical protein